MKKILIFAGTSEGRELFSFLVQKKVKCIASAATDYGALLLEKSLCGDFSSKVLKGRLNSEQIKDLLSSDDFLCVIDATHPFAELASREIESACLQQNIKYIRLSRKTKSSDGKGVFTFSSLKEAADFIEKDGRGRVLVATGSKEIKELCSIVSDKSRLFFRVLPVFKSLEILKDCKIEASQIIAMQGPFNRQMNEALLLQTKAEYLLTKETGLNGGFEEKIEAAKNCNVKSLVIKNPENMIDESKRKGLSFIQVIEELESLLKKDSSSFSFNLNCNREIILAGGGTGTLSGEVKTALDKSDIIFAAPSVISRISGYYNFGGKDCLPYYLFEDINSCLQERPLVKSPVVIFSGDTGFYSGAAKFCMHAEMAGYRVTILPGISSLQYFAAKIHEPWQDWNLISGHGRECSFIQNIYFNKKNFMLFSNLAQLKEICEIISRAKKNRILPEIKVTAACNLGLEDENIFEVLPSNLDDYCKEGLYVALFENTSGPVSLFKGFKDEDFLREEKIPMTKKEIRTMILSKLELCEDSVFYDIGCGSGSISIEAAFICIKGEVYSFDLKKEACTLTEKNKEHFCLQNISVINTKCPEGMEDFPLASHAFIGGSEGNLKEIVFNLLNKNPNIRIVISAVTLQTITEAFSLIKDLDEKRGIKADITELIAAKAKKLAGYDLMSSFNPIYLFSFGGEKIV